MVSTRPTTAVLNQEYHEKGDDGSRGVDDELPGVVAVKVEACHRPNHDQHDRNDERLGAS